MPSSKRSKAVSLTVTNKKGKVKKDMLVSSIRDALKNFKSVYTFSFCNMRSQYLKEIRRERLEDSRFFLGNNRVMSVACGRNQDDSYEPNLYKLSGFLKNSAGLFFTNLDKKQVKKLFAKDYVIPGFARCGAVSSEDITILAGALDAEKFPHSMIEQLSQLGLPTKLVKGEVFITDTYEVCKQGQVLSSSQCQLLKLFGHPVAEFKLTLTAHWQDGVARKIMS